MRPIIKVENLSKQYRIVARQAPYSTLRDSITEALRDPFGWLRRNGNREDGAIWALKDISFEVKPGEVVGVIGRNGAGKSTLLKVLSRITEPTTGQVDIYGRVGSLLEVGTGFHPELSGRENVYLNGAILGMKKTEIERKFDEIVAFAEIEKFIDTPVKYYSTGMYMRLAFAVAAHLESEILIVDEVLAVGDSTFQKKCLGKMGEVASEGRTVFFVSHNMAAVQKLCQRALLLKGGGLDQQGDVETVLANYLSDAFRSSDGVFDFSFHPTRSSMHEPVIRGLVLSSEAGQATTHFYPDDSLVAEITLESKRVITEPRVAIAIEDQNGSRIMTVASYFQHQKLSSIYKRQKVKCTIPCLGLGSGNYLISVSIGDKYHGLLDSINNAAWFDVGWRNNYGNGESYSAVYGPVLKQSTWAQLD